MACMLKPFLEQSFIYWRVKKAARRRPVLV